MDRYDDEMDVWEDSNIVYHDYGKHFNDEFDRNNPLYHGGDETPVPFDDMKIPDTMTTVYIDEDSKLKKLFDERNSLVDDDIVLLENIGQSLHVYKKSLTLISDTITLRVTQTISKPTSSIMNNKMRTMISDLRKYMKDNINILPHNLYDSAETLLKDLEMSTNHTQAKEIKKKLEKLQRESFDKQKDIIQKVKDKKNQLMPSLKKEFNNIIVNKDDNSQTQVEEMMCDKTDTPHNHTIKNKYNIS